MKKKSYFIFIIWLISILISVGWTFENPEKISKFKDVLKYNFSLGKILNNLKKSTSEKNLDKKKEIKKVKIDTAYNFLELEYFTVPVHSSYGGIDKIKDNIVYFSGNGDLFLLEKTKDQKISYKFKEIFSSKIDNKKEIFIKNNEPKVGKNAEKYFGIKDILIDNFKGFENKLLLASSLEYNEIDDCYTVGVYFSEITDIDTFEISKWKNIFSTKKCLSVDLTKNPRFAAASAGGRLVKIDEDHIVLSIGDFYADGVNGPSLSQDVSNMYGKIIKINIKNLSAKIFSLGHRNPQGLYVDRNKNIFSTEHGPTGGDELNYVVEGNNYGWPNATYGTNYKSYDAYEKKIDDNLKDWPKDITKNTHNGFAKPLFSWGNQVGISNIVVYEHNHFEKWNRNLIISTLATKQIIRMVYDYNKGSILYKENIKIGKRIRDIITMNDGRIALLTDRGKKLGQNPQIIIISKR